MSSTGPRPAGWQAVKRFALNTEGTDYVVGDLHGAYELMLKGLRKASFDSTKDRLFPVGDLVDRGEQSIRALRFLEMHGVHAVPGNHDDLWVDLYDQSGSAPSDELVHAIDNVMRGSMGPDWWLKADPAKRDALVAKFRELPIVIEIETRRGLVGIVHADVPPGLTWQQFTKRIEAGDQEVIDFALGNVSASRDRIHGNKALIVDGVDRVFVGHTTLTDGVRMFGNVIAVDTGAIRALRSNGDKEGHLTLAAITCNTTNLTQMLANRRSEDLVELIEDTPENNTPFSDYARPRG